MCGIAGIAAGLGRIVDVGELKRMSAAITHRGPDDQGACAWSPDKGISHAPDCERLKPGARVAFAHRRLSIIDTGSGGHQPMATPDNRHVLITNGEIYNYLELRRELEAEGATFRTQSDTEVLLQALVHWGIRKTLPRLTGMFAFAFLDTETHHLTLARDAFGIKPLMWSLRGDDLAFASELGALLTLNGLPRTVNPHALYDYLRFGLTDRGDRTLFQGVHHLPPGTWATINLDNPAKPQPEPYWQPSTDANADLSFDEAATELARLFRESIQLHLRADVPVGAALSGGIDSSAVVCAMREAEGQALDLHTFSFVSPGAPLDEEKWCDIVGGETHATMHKVTGFDSDLATLLDHMIDLQGEPFFSISAVAQNRVYGLVRNAGIKVTLDGQGADELLGGYTPFISARLAGLIRHLHVLRAARILRGVRPQLGTYGVAARAARFLMPMGVQAVARQMTGESLVPAWMDGAWFKRHDVAAAPAHRPRAGDILRGELADSMSDKVLPALLRYQDRNSMSHSVESRVPFLTTALADFVYSLPEAYLVSDHGETKSVFRAAMRGLVPDVILDRKDKIGFTIPQERSPGDATQWMVQSLVDNGRRAAPAFGSKGLSRMLEAGQHGNAADMPSLWRCALLARWANRFDVSFDA